LNLASIFHPPCCSCPPITPPLKIPERLHLLERLSLTYDHGLAFKGAFEYS
jgi:hypothetical protein